MAVSGARRRPRLRARPRRRRWWASGIWDEASVRPRRWVTAAGLALLAAAILLRSPALTSTPRIWAEEGTVYLHAAWESGPVSLPHPQLGYYSLLPNLAAYVASLLPPAWVPLPLMGAGLLAMLACGAAILTSRSRLFDRLWVRLVSMLAVVCVPSAIGELWLNSINAQHVLTVAAFVLILEPDPRLPQRLLFLVAALTAPTVTFLLPLVLLRAVVGPRRSGSDRLLIAAVAAALVQVAAVLLTSNDRRGRDTGDTDALGWVAFLGKAFLGPGHADHDAAVVGALVLGALVVLGACCRGQALVVAGIVTGLWVFGLNTAFSLGQDGGYRYWYAPSVLLVMTTASAAGLVRSGVVPRVVAGLLCIVLLASGARTYVTGLTRVHDRSWTTWTDQLPAACGPDRIPVRIWPQGRAAWYVTVPVPVCARR